MVLRHRRGGGARRSGRWPASAPTLSPPEKNTANKTPPAGAFASAAAAAMLQLLPSPRPRPPLPPQRRPPLLPLYRTNRNAAEQQLLYT